MIKQAGLHSLSQEDTVLEKPRGGGGQTAPSQTLNG